MASSGAHAKYWAAEVEASWWKTQDLDVSVARKLANGSQARRWVNSSNRCHVVKRFRGGRGFAGDRGRGCIEVQSNHPAALDDVTLTSCGRSDTLEPGTKGDRQRA